MSVTQYTNWASHDEILHTHAHTHTQTEKTKFWCRIAYSGPTSSLQPCYMFHNQAGSRNIWYYIYIHRNVRTVFRAVPLFSIIVCGDKRDRFLVLFFNHIRASSTSSTHSDLAFIQIRTTGLF